MNAVIDEAAMELRPRRGPAGARPRRRAVGAVVVRDGEVIAARHNERELTGDPTAHAEILALRDAAAVVGHWRLDDCTLVVTLEPCVMCAGAIVNARVGRLVYGATDPKAGAVGSLYDVVADPRLNHRTRSPPGSRPTRPADLLREFFAARRVERPLACPPGRMPERTNGTASKAVEVLRASVGSNPTPSTCLGNLAVRG